MCSGYSLTYPLGNTWTFMPTYDLNPLPALTLNPPADFGILKLYKRGCPNPYEILSVNRRETHTIADCQLVLLRGRSSSRFVRLTASSWKTLFISSVTQPLGLRAFILDNCGWIFTLGMVVQASRIKKAFLPF